MPRWTLRPRPSAFPGPVADAELFFPLRTHALRKLPEIGNLLTTPAQAFDNTRFREALLERGSYEVAANMLWGDRFLAIPGGLPIVVRVVRAPASCTRADLLHTVEDRPKVGCPDANKNENSY